MPCMWWGVPCGAPHAVLPALQPQRRCLSIYSLLPACEHPRPEGAQTTSPLSVGGAPMALISGPGTGSNTPLEAATTCLRASRLGADEDCPFTPPGAHSPLPPASTCFPPAGVALATTLAARRFVLSSPPSGCVAGGSGAIASSAIHPTPTPTLPPAFPCCPHTPKLALPLAHILLRTGRRNPCQARLNVAHAYTTASRPGRRPPWVHQSGAPGEPWRQHASTASASRPGCSSRGGRPAP